jgi:hypothetical protein
MKVMIIKCDECNIEIDTNMAAVYDGIHCVEAQVLGTVFAIKLSKLKKQDIDCCNKEHLCLGCYTKKLISICKELNINIKGNKGKK